MRHLLWSILACSIGAGVIVALTSIHLAGQSAATPRRTETNTWAPSKTPWGDPDLQGIWSYATITPRAADWRSRKEFLSDEESPRSTATPRSRAPTSAIRTRPPTSNRHNAFWWDRGRRRAERH
jgi:hypothetical protein